MLLHNSFQKSRALFCFNPNIYENGNELDCRKWLFPANIKRILLFNCMVCLIMKKSHIREWEEINRLMDFNRALIRRKKAGEIKDVGCRLEF